MGDPPRRDVPLYIVQRAGASFLDVGALWQKAKERHFDRAAPKGENSRAGSYSINHYEISGSKFGSFCKFFAPSRMLLCFKQLADATKGDETNGLCFGANSSRDYTSSQ